MDIRQVCPGEETKPIALRRCAHETQHCQHHVPLPITPNAAWHEGYLRLSLTPRGYLCLAECNHRDIQVEVVTTARILEQGSLDATDRSNTMSTRWLVRDTRSCSCCVCLACDPFMSTNSSKQ